VPPRTRDPPLRRPRGALRLRLREGLAGLDPERAREGDRGGHPRSGSEHGRQVRRMRSRLLGPVRRGGFFFAELTRRGRHMLRHIHTLATRYHWSEEAILRLPTERRLAFLALIEADDDQALLAELDPTLGAADR